MSLTRDIHADPARASLAGALVSFAKSTGSVLMAEGVESEQELAALRTLGVTQGQGYHLGRPGTLEQALRIATPPKRRARA